MLSFLSSTPLDLRTGPPEVRLQRGKESGLGKAVLSGLLRLWGGCMSPQRAMSTEGGGGKSKYVAEAAQVAY